jgi:hypothetical protein
VVDTHDIFYVQTVLQKRVGRVDHFMNQKFRSVPPLQVFVLVQEIVRTCKRAKHYLKKRFSRFQLDFDAVECKHRLARPEDHAHNIIKLACRQGLLEADADDADDGSSTVSEEDG